VEKIHINIFQSKEDTKVDPLTTSWDNIVAFFTSPHETTEDKFKVTLFNFVKYKDLSEVPDYSEDWIMDPWTGKSYVRRKQVNIVENDVFVIDYDDTSSLKDVKSRFQDYEYIYYTSYRHLHDDKTEKFRFIIPFTKSVPSWREKDEYGNVVSEGEWYRIIDSLKEITGPCDLKSFDPNTIYNKPSCPKSRLHLSQSGYHKGKKLDWTQLDRSEFISSELYSNKEAYKSDIDVDCLDPDTILQTKHGPIKISDVTGKIEGVLCPNPQHNDKNGTEFVRRVEDTGNIFVHCKKCNRNYYMRRGEGPSNKEKEKHYKSQDDLIDDVLEFPDDKIYENPDDRKLVISHLEKIRRIIDKDVGHGHSMKPEVYVPTDLYLRRFKSHIIYMTEGAGKSRLVLDMAKDGNKIIFACKSWEQVEAKYQEYLKIGINNGFNVKVIRSKDAKSRRRFKTKLVRSEQEHPYTTSRILDEESIQQFIKNNPDLSPEFIRLSWQFFTSDKLPFDSIPRLENDEDVEIDNDEVYQLPPGHKIRIILTTFEQLRIHKLKNVNIPKDWLIWFDDPDIMDMVDIEPYDTSKWKELSDKDFEKNTKEINGTTYFRRNFHQSLGYSLKEYKCIYTTT